MADNLTPFDTSGAPAAPKPGIRGFLNSKAGKIIVGVAGVIVVVGILGIIGAAFLGSGTSQDVATPTDSASGGATVTKPVTPVSEVKVPDDVELDDVFTYRDVFVPTVVLVSTTTTSTTSNSTSTNTSTTNQTTTPENTLVLEDIATENGEPVAVLSWNGETYKLAEGESIPNTPWKVLEINSSTVVMLYGDARITLGVGVGISK